MAKDKRTEEEYVHRLFYSPLSSMQFATMQTPKDMNGLDAWALQFVNPVVT